MIHDTIILIDDDQDDLDLIEQAIKVVDTNIKVLLFNDAVLAHDYLQDLSFQPLFILCDVNMSKMNGLQLRGSIYKNEALRLLTVPFLFLSTSQAPPNIKDAYNLCAQGYFVKPPSYSQLLEMIEAMINYWKLGRHPT